MADSIAQMPATERHQYAESLCENLYLLRELITVIHQESTVAGDWTTAVFCRELQAWVAEFASAPAHRNS